MNLQALQAPVVFPVVLPVVKLRTLAANLEIASSVVRAGTGRIPAQTPLAHRAGNDLRALGRQLTMVLRMEHASSVEKKAILVMRVRMEGPRNREVWLLHPVVPAISVVRKGILVMPVPMLEGAGRKAAPHRLVLVSNVGKKDTIATLAPAEGLDQVTEREEQAQKEGVVAAQAELRALEEAASGARRSLDSLLLMVTDSSFVFLLLSLYCFYVWRYE